MTIRFSAAVCPIKARLSGARARTASQPAANDNGSEAAFDAMLTAALRHFGTHGLQAGRDAHRRARDAFLAGDRDNYEWWMALCRVIDRRLAQDLAQLQTGADRQPQRAAGQTAATAFMVTPLLTSQ